MKNKILDKLNYHLKRSPPAMKILFLIFISILFAPEFAYSEKSVQFEILPRVVNQGEVCALRVSAPASWKSLIAEFRKEKIPLVSYDSPGKYEAIWGIDLDTPPGKYKIILRAVDGKGRSYLSSKHLVVKKVHFQTQHLSLPPAMVDLDARTLERVNEEERRLKALFQRVREAKIWKGPFIWPLQGEITTPFGLRRIINQQLRNPHSGIDLRAKEGTPVLASNNGLVALIDEFFFSGKSVVLDHGWGIFSMYFHLLDTMVEEGKMVNKGSPLGRVGSTGRSTGPHLHWGIRIQNARVDPVSLMRLTENLR